MERLLTAFFVARVPPAPREGGAAVAAAAPFCRFSPPGVVDAVSAPSVGSACAFCFPAGASAVRASAYLVTQEFTFTLTGGDGGRLHGVCRRTHDPTYCPPARPGGGTADAKRWPQVLCILSPHCWQAFFGKALEVVEQLLAPHSGLADLPPDAPAALFLASLPAQLAAVAAPSPLGAVLRVPLPYSGAPVSVDRMRRALAPPGQRNALLGLTADAIELEVRLSRRHAEPACLHWAAELEHHCPAAQLKPPPPPAPRRCRPTWATAPRTRASRWRACCGSSPRARPSRSSPRCCWSAA